MLHGETQGHRWSQQQRDGSNHATRVPKCLPRVCLAFALGTPGRCAPPPTFANGTRELHPQLTVSGAFPPLC